MQNALKILHWNLWRPIKHTSILVYDFLRHNSLSRKWIFKEWPSSISNLWPNYKKYHFMLCVAAHYLKMTFCFFGIYDGNVHLDSLKKKKVWERHVGKIDRSYILLKQCTFFRKQIVICSKNLHGTFKSFVLLWNNETLWK